MTNNGNEGSSEFEEKVDELGGTEKINKDNTTEALTSVIKHIIDKVLLHEQTLSKQDQDKLKKLLGLLNEIKDITTEYSEFFDENKEEIEKIISSKDNITVLNKELTYNYDLISGLYDYLDKNFIELIESLKSTKNFFKLSNFGDDGENKFDLLLEALDNSTTPEEKLSTLEGDLRDLEGIVQTLSRDINSYSSIMDGFIEKISSTSRGINESYVGNIEGFFGGYTTGNVSFEYKKSEILPFFLDNLIEKIPSKYTYANSFKKDLLTLFNSDKLDLIMGDEFVTTKQINLFRDLHSFYKKVSKKYKKINDTIDKIYDKEEQKRFAFDKIEDDNKGYKILDIFKDGENKFLEDVDKVARKDKKIYKIDKEKDSVGSEEARKAKKKVYDEIMKIYSEIKNLNSSGDFILSDQKVKINTISSELLRGQEITLQLESKNIKSKKKLKLEEELEKLKKDEEIETIFSIGGDTFENYVLGLDFNTIIFNIIKYKKEYEDLIDKEREESKDKSIENDSDKFTQHYKLKLGGDHGGTVSLEKENMKKPAKVVGKVPREIIEKITHFAGNAKRLRIINSVFPGANNTLEGNLIILGPWGGGKTALLNELAYNKNIITIEINKSDLLSTWYGQTEKIIDGLWMEAVALHKKTGKEVFMFFDEVDNLFKGTGLSCGGGPDIQKELQTRLDGLKDYEGVHFVGLSNVPHKIPIDIYRRMEKTYVMDELELSDKVDLFYSRLDQFPIADDLKKFLSVIVNKVDDDKNTVEKIKKSGVVFDMMNFLIEEGEIDTLRKVDYEDFKTMIAYYSNTLGLSDLEAEALAQVFITTPKILYQVTERFFKNYIDGITNKEVKALDKKIKKLNKKKKVKKEMISEAFTEVLGRELTLSDFKIALDDIFSNASVMAEIKGNSKFFKLADKMINAISSNAFDGFDDENDDNSGGSITINLGKKGGCSDGSCST